MKKKFLALIFGISVSLVLVLAVELTETIYHHEEMLSHIKLLFAGRQQNRDWLNSTNGVGPLKRILNSSGREYSVSLDPFGKRVVPSIHNEKRDKYALFFGCSMIYGDGLHDNQTIPYFFSEKNAEFFAYNYGWSGSGPNHILFRLQHSHLRNEVRQSEGIAFYNFIDAHVLRTKGTTHTMGYNPEGPFYRLGLDGRLNFLGSFRQARGWTNWILEFIANSYAFKPWVSLDREVSEITKPDIDLTCALIKEVERETRRQLTLSRFIVLIYPENYQPISECLLSKQMEVWNFGDRHRDLRKLSWDGFHPIAEENRLYVDLLTERLAKK